jgi:anti-sigma B factor antagonist
MAKSGQNEGCRVLDDFVCEALADPAVPKAAPTSRGRNEGMQLLQSVDVTVGTGLADPANGGLGGPAPLTTESVRGVLVVRFAKPSLDEQEGEQLADLVREQGARKVLLDLDGADYISGLFVAKLVGLHRQIRAAGGRLVLCNLGKQVAEIFSLLHLHQVFPIYNSLQQAMSME